MKIVFFLSNLSSGGAERTVAYLSSYLAKKGDDVRILLFEDEVFYNLHPDVKVKVLNIKSKYKYIVGKYTNIAQRFIKTNGYLKKEKPDVVLSFCVKTNYRAMMASFRTKIPVIVSVRNDPKIDYVGTANGIMNKLFLNRAAGCVFQTEEAKEFFDEVL